MIDLRSDTVTRPTAEMLEAMRTAPLGDDVLGDDPTVHELEQEAARMLGFEAAVYTPSGTMANQIALAVHCQRGDSVILDEEAHILYYEVGAPAVIGQVVTRTCPSKLGVMDPVDVERLVLVGSLHTPGTSLLCVENTHNRSGGQVLPLDVLGAYREIANRRGLKLHLDGARLFNAATWLNQPVSTLAAPFDSVSICLSKGLGAPVGSVLVGSKEFMEHARVWRKRLGGGMRQAGLLAACGLVALRVQSKKLGDDHRRARRLAEGLQGLPGITVDLAHQCTNFVMVQTQGLASDYCLALTAEGVSAMPAAPHRVRLVTHSDISDDDVERAIEAFRIVANERAERQPS